MSFFKTEKAEKLFVLFFEARKLANATRDENDNEIPYDNNSYIAAKNGMNNLLVAEFGEKIATAIMNNELIDSEWETAIEQELANESVRIIFEKSENFVEQIKKIPAFQNSHVSIITETIYIDWHGEEVDFPVAMLYKAAEYVKMKLIG